MPRPYKGGLDYFQHDTKPDDKIKVLESIFEKDGYIFYFKLLEKIYYEDNQELDISIPEIKQVIVKDLLISEDRFNEIMTVALKIGLFDKEKYSQGIITSHGIKTRAEVVLRSRLKMRAWREAHKPAEQEEISTDAKQTNPWLSVRYDKTTQQWQGITDEIKDILQKLYPGVDLDKQIEAAGRWLYGKGKQYKDMKRFLCNWMDNVVNERFQKSNNKSFKDSDIKIKEI